MTGAGTPPVGTGPAGDEAVEAAVHELAALARLLAPDRDPVALAVLLLAVAGAVTAEDGLVLVARMGRR